MMKNGKYGHIDIQMKEYSLAKNISQLMDDLSKVFLKITLDLSPCSPSR